jgi:hypothetical protein
MVTVPSADGRDVEAGFGVDGDDLAAFGVAGDGGEHRAVGGRIGDLDGARSDDGVGHALFVGAVHAGRAAGSARRRRPRTRRRVSNAPGAHLARLGEFATFAALGD